MFVYFHGGGLERGDKKSADVLINNSWTDTTTVKFDTDAAVAYVLSGKSGMRSRTMCLNGKELVLGANDELPELAGMPVSEKPELSPGECAFIVV